MDGSWTMSINMALHKGLTFGREWVFTFGPLGFLSTRQDLYVGRLPFLIFDIFCVCILIYVLSYALKKIKDPVKCLVIPYLLVMTAHNSEINFSLFTLLIFLIFHSHTEKSNVSLLLATFMSVLSFFVKFNLGLISSIVLYGYMLYETVLDRGKAKKNLLFFTVHVVLIAILCRFLHVDLIGYIKGGLHVINNYNDAMFTSPYDFRRYFYFNAGLAIVIILATAVTVIGSLPLLWKTRFDRFIILVTMLALYLGFKQGFTRYSSSGMPYFFFYGAFFVGIAYLFIGHQQLKNRFGTLFGVFIFISPFVSTGLGLSFNKITFPYQNLIFQNPSQRITSEIKIKAQYQIDPAITNRMKGKTVDAFPFEIAYVLYNGLDYNPRPAIQSYQAYNDYLTTLNYNKYISASAPDYIIYEVGPSTDRFRYAFWSDAKSTMAILRNYDYDTTTISNDTLQILKKRELIKPLKISDRRNITASLGKEIQVSDKGKLTWMKAEVNYSVWGKLRRILAQPPILLVEATYEDGHKEIIKGIVSELKAGVFLKDVHTEAQGAHFVKTRGDAPSITKLRFTGSTLDFAQDINISLEDVSFE
ncbi:hypothetical protein [Dyadobacter helix]|nr:hypothetical protein [Dyadobacter sp. CECT 9275]